MALSVEEVRRIAHLARLSLSPEEEERLAVQLAQIVDYIDQLKGFETAPVRPAESSVPEAPDVERATPGAEGWLHNAPAALDHFFLVPQIKTPGDG